MCDIGELHNTLSLGAYDELLSCTIDKWKKDPELSGFVKYFKEQWVDSKFCNWQIFKVPVGYSMTNSPIERYNRTIKDSFTKRLKHHLKTALEVFQDVVTYESNKSKEFRSEVRVRKYMRDLAKTIILRKQLIATANDSEFLYRHFNKKLGLARINTTSKTCSCHKYFDKGICKHLIAACIQNNISLPGLLQMPKRFQIIRRRKVRQYKDISQDEDGLELPANRALQLQEAPQEIPNEVLNEIRNEAPIVVQNVQEEIRNEAPIVVQNEIQNEVSNGVQEVIPNEVPYVSQNKIPKKRKQKPKLAAEPLVDKGGRPPLVSAALHDDTAPVTTLRRSNRKK